MLDFKQDIRDNLTKGQEWIADNCIFLTKAGSHLYGTNHKDSDTDLVGVTIPPTEYWITSQSFEQYRFKSDEHNYEGAIFSIKKFLTLCVDNNPNILENIFINKDNPNVLYWSDTWDRYIYNNRVDLLCKLVYHRFRGFAFSQIQKLERKQQNKTGRQYIIKEKGFDTKFAMNAFRLTDQCSELLLNKTITFPRPNASYLLDVRQGNAYSSEKLDDLINDLKAREKDLLTDCDASDLPHKKNVELMDQVLYELFMKNVLPKETNANILAIR